MTLHPAVANGSYDVARVREDFPALALKVYGKQLVYLDNAASAQQVIAITVRSGAASNGYASATHAAIEGPHRPFCQGADSHPQSATTMTRQVGQYWGIPTVASG